MYTYNRYTYTTVVSWYISHYILNKYILLSKFSPIFPLFSP